GHSSLVYRMPFSYAEPPVYSLRHVLHLRDLLLHTLWGDVAPEDDDERVEEHVELLERDGVGAAEEPDVLPECDEGAELVMQLHRDCPPPARSPHRLAHFGDGRPVTRSEEHTS